MRESVEFRIREENARLLPPGVGESLGYGVQRVIVDTDDPLFEEIGRLHREFRAEGDYFFSGREYHRHYSQKELRDAEVLHVWPKRVFEPAGEECGTTYADQQACPVCGAGAPQTSPLFLPARRIPKGFDFAQTIAGEIVVSAGAVAAFRAGGLSGVSFEAVRSSEDPKTRLDHFQLTVTGQSAEVHPATRAGEDPFDEKSYGHCPRGDVLGLNLLSEVSLVKESVSQLDVTATRQMVGVRRGLLRPQPLLLFSPRAWTTVREAKLRGLEVEVARLV